MNLVPNVNVVLGSSNDRRFLDKSKLAEIFTFTGVPWELDYISAHRNPATLYNHIVSQKMGSYKIFIAATGMNAALPGSISAVLYDMVPIPVCQVYGVALPSEEFPNAMDALLAIVRNPPGVPVSCTGIGAVGLTNAAISACQLVASYNETIGLSLNKYLISNRKPPQLDVLKSEIEKKQ